MVRARVARQVISGSSWSETRWRGPFLACGLQDKAIGLEAGSLGLPGDL